MKGGIAATSHQISARCTSFYRRCDILNYQRYLSAVLQVSFNLAMQE